MSENMARTQDLFDRFLDEGVRPHSELIAPIISDCDVAVVAFEPMNIGKKALRTLGWNGRVPVLRLEQREADRLAQNLVSQGDHAGGAWLADRRFGRIFGFVHGGTLMVNLHPGGGFSVEPGTLDHEWMS